MNDITRLFNVYRTVHEMLSDRGYDKGLIAAKVDDIKTFEDKFVSNGMLDRLAMNFIVGKDSDNVLIYFIAEDSIGIKHLKKLYTQMIQMRISHCILIYPKVITSSAKKYILEKSKVVIEQFAEDEVVHNITKHALLPKHVLCDEAEKSRILETYNLTETNLPRILHTDPMARYLGLKRGDVVKILRKSETAGINVTFRLCS